MDISEFLVSQQTDPQSRALAANVFHGSAGADKAGAIPEPQSPSVPTPGEGATADPATAGIDQASLDAGGASAEDYTQQDDVEEFAMGGMVGRRRRRRGGGGGGSRGGGGADSNLRNQPNPGSSNLPPGSISDIGYYDPNGNLLGISGMGVTRDQVRGTTNRNVDNGMWEGAGAAGDSSGAGSDYGGSGGNLPVGAEGGEVNEMIGMSDGAPRGFGPEYSEEIDDRRDRDELLRPDAMRFSEGQIDRNSLAADREFAGTHGRVPKYAEGGEVDEESAIPMPDNGEDISGEIDEEPRSGRQLIGDAIGMRGRKAQEAVAQGRLPAPEDLRAAFLAARDYGYGQHGANAALPDPAGVGGIRDMMGGAGAISPEQANAALKAFNGDGGKAMHALHAFYNEKSTPGATHEQGEPAPAPDAKRGGGMAVLSGDEDLGAGAIGAGAQAVGRGAQAAWGMFQHLRGMWGKASAMTRVAAEQGNAPVAAKAAEAALNYLPDSVMVGVKPAPDGTFHLTTSDGGTHRLDATSLAHVMATPFDKAAHMGTGHLLSVNTQQAEAVKARMAQQDQQQGLGPDGAPVAAPQSARSAPPEGAGEGDELPREIKMVRGSYMTGGGRGSPVTMHSQSSQRVDARTGDIIPEQTPQERVAATAGNARMGQERIRQEGLTQRAMEGSASPKGREAQLKMQRERQALVAANAELKEAADTGKPLDRATVYKKYGLEHLLAGGGGGAPQPGAPAPGKGDMERRMINGVPYEKVQGGWKKVSQRQSSLPVG